MGQSASVAVDQRTVPRSGSVEIVSGADGSRIHCVQEGAGPTVVLAHGYLLEHRAFELVFGALVQAGYRVIAFDQRGHGQSRAGSAGAGSAAAASDYAAVLEHFQVEDGILVGHSMGAFLALVFCLQHPDIARRRLRRLVLLGGNAGHVGAGSLQNRVQMPVLASGLLTALWRLPPLGRALLASLFGTHKEPHFVERTRAMVASQDVRLSLPLLQAMSNENYYDRLHEIPIEARVICGELDRTCPPHHSRRIGSGLAKASNVWLPNIGHMLAYEAPNAVIEAVRVD